MMSACVPAGVACARAGGRARQRDLVGRPPVCPAGNCSSKLLMASLECLAPQPAAVLSLLLAGGLAMPIPTQSLQPLHLHGWVRSTATSPLPTSIVCNFVQSIHLPPATYYYYSSRHKPCIAPPARISLSPLIIYRVPNSAKGARE